MSWIPTATLFTMMLALGMTLRPEQFRVLFAEPGAVALGLLGQLVLLPIVAWSLAWGLDLPPTIAIGLALIAACPGGVTSNVLSWLARGDVALSISLTAVTSSVAFVTVPFWTALALRTFGGDGPHVALPIGETVSTLFLSTALPVGAGMALLHFRPGIAERLHRPLLGVSTTVLLFLIVGLAISTWGSAHDLANLVRQAAPAVVALGAITMGIGLASARLLALRAATSRTIAIEIGVQNFNLALVVAVTLLDGPRYVGPALLYLPVMLALAFGIVAMGRRDPDPSEFDSDRLVRSR
jgi:BASS family bile acid:Na+ symporter